ncbi:hypothetical protein PO909_019981 [Leuciscus waleckii]
MALDGSSTSVMAHNNPYHSHVSDYYGRKLSNKPDVVPSGVTERKVSPSDKPDMVVLDVVGIKDSDAPGHRKKHETDTYVLGTIHPFRKTHRSVLGKCAQEFSLVTSDRRSWRILLFGVLNIVCTACLLMWCSSTNSMGEGSHTHYPACSEPHRTHTHTHTPLRSVIGLDQFLFNTNVTEFVKCGMNKSDVELYTEAHDDMDVCVCVCVRERI